MPRQNGEGDFMTKDGERRFAENLRKVLLSDNPNPRRKGRPDPKTIHDLAFHSRIGNPEAFERATSHNGGMLRCVRAAVGFAEQYKELRRRRQAARAALALAGVLVVSVHSLDSPAKAREPGNRGGGPAARPGCHRCRKTAGQGT